MFNILSAAIALPYVFSSAVAFAGDSETGSTGRTITGTPLGTDVQGNPNDKNSEGNRAEDAEGNVSKDIYGNKTGSDKK